MKVRPRHCITCTLALLFCAVPALAHGERPAHGRISYDAEGTYLQGKHDDDWAHASLNTLVLVGDTIWVDRDSTSEVELDTGTYLRMADGANIEVLALVEELRVRAVTGSFYLHRLQEAAGDLHFETPAAHVMVPPASLIRVDIEPTGGTTVYVLEGTATITIGAEHRQSLGSGLQVFVEPGHLASEAIRFDRLSDDFEAWNRERVGYITAGYGERSGAPEFDRQTLGVAELSSSGRWIEHQGARYWRPDPALGYVPYRDGYWTNVATCGDVWVGRYGFEYTTSHYGRWSYVERLGWLWRYEPVWSPAWVAAVKYGSHFVWSPLGLDNRPVLVGGAASFRVGSLTFSLGASTLVPVEQVYLGYAHVQPLRIDLLPRVEERDIQIWNIDINNVVINTLGGDFGGYGRYKSASGRSVRGLFSVGQAKRAPRDVVEALRISVGATADFTWGGKALAGPSVRAKGVKYREVHLKEHAKLAWTQAGPGHGKAKIKVKDSDAGVKVKIDGKAQQTGGPSEKDKKGGGAPSKDKSKGGSAEKGGPAADKSGGGPPDKSPKDKSGGGAKAKGADSSSKKGDQGGGDSKSKGGGGSKDKGEKGGKGGGKK